MTGFIGASWMPDHELGDLFHWPTPDPAWLADDECEHGRLPTDRNQPCGCWSDLEVAA